eukprot:TRINITY_DN1691_c0_g1_i2.p1 TRINITY_DN1691_c0_g1~~TRINITY_DN1691_c0_g1_i2.p1  ORF type:complete len:207 (-),score=28.41 TRINITY_DN1691_c0_g1_i2:13-633(-)
MMLTKYLGNVQAINNREMLKEIGITHIVNCCSKVEIPNPYEDDFMYLQLNLCDQPHPFAFKLKPFVERVLEFVNEHKIFYKESNKKLLVNCLGGKNRSPSIITGLILTDHMKIISENKSAISDRLNENEENNNNNNINDDNDSNDIGDNNNDHKYSYEHLFSLQKNNDTHIIEHIINYLTKRRPIVEINSVYKKQLYEYYNSLVSL